MSDAGSGSFLSSLQLAEEALPGLKRAVAICPLKHRQLARDVVDAAALAMARMQDVSTRT